MNKQQCTICIIVGVLLFLGAVAGGYFIISRGQGSRVVEPLEMRPAAPLATCNITGCSREICAEEEVMSTCQMRSEYVCYKSARCERQSSGQCGWTLTPKLNTCLEGARSRDNSLPTRL